MLPYYNKYTTQHCLSCIEAAHAITYLNELTMLAIRYIMSMIVSSCQHCDEQQFQALSCVHYTIFLVVKLDLFIRALTRDHILALEMNVVHQRSVIGSLLFNGYCGTIQRKT